MALSGDRWRRHSSFRCERSVYKFAVFVGNSALR
jgi:hypothetical protein